MPMANLMDIDSRTIGNSSTFYVFVLPDTKNVSMMHSCLLSILIMVKFACGCLLYSIVVDSGKVR